MSDYLENEILDHVFKTGDWTAPTNLLVALYTAVPSDTGGGTELTSAATGYERVAQDVWDAGSGGATENTSAVTFTTAGAAWGTIVAAGIFDASAAGNLLWWGTLTTNKSVGNGDQVEFAIGAIDVTLD
jgi:hypothetical protein